MKTAPSPTNPDEVFSELSDAKRADGEYLVDLFQEVTGLPPVVWGRKIIGFGSYDYTYASGHSGTAARVGFAVAERQISLYLACDADEFEPFFERLGPVKRGKGCIYITRLARVDLDVLREMIEHAWALAREL
ncbi:DUF1801 domain-containing protein [Staphylococcus chromogenes]|nr:DUF1801 domain-containing protein [Staphylococcus chromogenes]